MSKIGDREYLEELAAYIIGDRGDLLEAKWDILDDVVMGIDPKGVTGACIYYLGADLFFEGDNLCVHINLLVADVVLDIPRGEVDREAIRKLIFVTWLKHLAVAHKELLDKVADFNLVLPLITQSCAQIEVE